MTGNERDRIGIFGGSFDPPHAAHVMLAAYVLSIGEIDRLMVIPNAKHALDKRSHASFAHRRRMCELAFADLRRVEVSSIEQELGGTSYTLDTLEELRRRHPGSELRLVVGEDILRELDRWHRFDRVAKLAPPIVIGRSGAAVATAATYALTVMPVSLPEISSTDVRERLATGRPVIGLVPSAVADYATEHGLYRSGDDAQ